MPKLSNMNNDKIRETVIPFIGSYVEIRAEGDEGFSRHYFVGKLSGFIMNEGDDEFSRSCVFSFEHQEAMTTVIHHPDHPKHHRNIFIDLIDLKVSPLI